MNVMDGLSTVVLLALLTLGNTTPPTVTQIPRTDKDVLGEVENDGFILLTSLITKAPQKQTTAQQTTTTEGEVEGSAMGESPVEPSTTAGTTPADTILADTAQASTTQTTSMAFIPIQSTGVMATTTTESEVRTTTESSEDKEPKVTTIADLLSTMSDSGSGDEQSTFSHGLEGSGGSEDWLINSPTIKAAAKVRGLGYERREGETEQQQDNVTKQPNGHVTPDWIIILGFLVGLAALVLICVAIATREKWNGPDQFNKTGVTLTPLNQQREVELEEFLHKTHPKENGKMEEYTVIPLEELPNEYSS